MRQGPVHCDRQYHLAGWILRQVCCCFVAAIARTQSWSREFLCQAPTDLHVVQQSQVRRGEAIRPLQLRVPCDDQAMTAGLGVGIRDQHALLIYKHATVRCAVPAGRQH